MKKNIYKKITPMFLMFNTLKKCLGLKTLECVMKNPMFIHQNMFLYLKCIIMVTLK